MEVERERETEVLCVLLSESANKVALKSSQHLPSILIFKGLPRWFCGKESTRQCRRCRKRGFSHWFGNIPWRRRRQPFPGFLPGKSQGQASLVGYSLGVAVSQTGLSTLTLIFKLLHVLIILVWLKSWFILTKTLLKTFTVFHLLYNRSNSRCIQSSSLGLFWGGKQIGKLEFKIGICAKDLFFLIRAEEKLFLLLSLISFSNFQKHGFRHTAGLPERTHLLHLHELLPGPRHHRLWAQLLPSLSEPLLGRRPDPKELPWVQGTIREAWFPNQHCPQEAGFPCQTGQSWPRPQLWGADLRDTPGSQRPLLWGWPDPALWALLWTPRARSSQPQANTQGCWGDPGRWCLLSSLGSRGS